MPWSDSTEHVAGATEEDEQNEPEPKSISDELQDILKNNNCLFLQTLHYQDSYRQREITV